MKLIVKSILIFNLLMMNTSFATATLSFQKQVWANAQQLGDILHIEQDPAQWSHRALESHPKSCEVLTRERILAWMNVNPTTYIWLGKTRTTVQCNRQTSAKALLDKAQQALIQQLKPSYHHVVVKPLSKVQDSEYALNEIEPLVTQSYPTPKRVCVWLIPQSKQSARVAIWFEVQAYARVLVARHKIRSNTPLLNKDWAFKMCNIAGLHTAPRTDYPQGQWLKSSITKGDILTQSHLKKIPLIVQGQTVSVTFHHKGITLTMEAVAINDGDLNETITVQTPHDKRRFQVTVDGPQHAVLQ